MRCDAVNVEGHRCRQTGSHAVHRWWNKKGDRQEWSVEVVSDGSGSD